MDNSISLGNKIYSALTTEQLCSLLDALLDLNMDTILQKLNFLDKETAQTVENILRQGQSGIENQSIASLLTREKLQEIWDDLWEKWEEIVSEVGDEDGKYSIQEVHWEPPYFSSFSLSSDLEDIAQQMIPYLDRAFEEFREPELFPGAITNIDYYIHQYPEFMGVEYEDILDLGPSTTYCLLRWIWLESGSKDNQAQTFLESLTSLYNTVELIDLDATECGKFISDLPWESSQRIYQLLDSFMDGMEIEDFDSPWIHIQDSLDKMFNPDKYLQTCENNLDSDWLYGLDLIEHSITNQEFEIAEKWLSMTTASHLSLPVEEGWYPEQSLYMDLRPFIDRGEKKNLDYLWQAWIIVEDKLENHVRKVAAELQRTIFEDCNNIDKVLETYQECSNFPEATKYITPIFQAWKDHLARSRELFLSPESGKESTWLHWLIEARYMGNKGKEYFQENMEKWLEKFKQEPDRIRKDLGALSCLTIDLSSISSLKKKLLALTKLRQMEDPELYLEEELAPQRRHLLKQFYTENIVQLTIQAWEKISAL